MVQYLLNEMNIPNEMIEIEVPMSYFRKGARGRADIIVYGTSETARVPVLIVECKAPHIPLTDDVFDQVVTYDEIIFANTVIFTNGQELYIYSWNEEKHDYLPLRSLPSYDDLVSLQKLEFIFEQNLEWIRPTKEELKIPEVIEEFRDFGWLGEDTPILISPFILELACFLRDTSRKLLPQKKQGLKIISDCGLRYTTFGNAAGGSWEGDYRYFILEDDKGNSQIISITILGSLKCVNDPKFGTRKGTTTLIVAIDDYEVSHNSIQLNLDKYVMIQGNKYIIWHDGTLTKGKQGAVRKSDVLNFIRDKAPELMSEDNDRIILGTFISSQGLDWNDKTTVDFIIKLIKYALIRDQYRRLK